MKDFAYKNPATIAEASNLLKQDGRVLLAGGTDLLDVLRNRLVPEYPKEVVSLKNVSGMRYIREDKGYLHIGAMTTLAELAGSELVREKAPALAQAAESVATPNLRSTATLGGNLCQDIRCWYYRYPNQLGGRVNCARKEGHLCSAMMGENRYHSIFGAAKVCTTPCTGGCPAHTDISAYMEKLREGNVEEAARIILEANPMPAITSRVCAHFCQEQCNRQQYDERVNIGDVERYVGDYILEHHDEFMRAPAGENGRKIAIVGSGPAGLAAAYYMRESGYLVTVYERMKEAGGCLAYAIPEYRLPKAIVRKYISILEGMGIRFVLNTKVGEDIELEEIRAGYDSVLLDTGAWKRPLIGISGEELTRFGLDFLVEVNSYIQERPGAEVVVVGGGNVAVDVAITAKRLGAPKVTMICLESREQMPANREEVERVLEEGIEIINGWGPELIMKEGPEDAEKVSGVRFKACVSTLDASGRFAPVYEEERKLELKAYVVFMAIGQRSDLGFLEGACKVETERGRVKVEKEFGTSQPGIFAAGDVTTGPATVVKALAAGKGAAVMMNRYLGGDALLVETEGYRPGLVRFSADCEKISRAQHGALLPAEERAMHKEDQAGLSKEMMTCEAGRCMNCGCLAVNPSDTANALLAEDAVIRTNMRSLTAEELLTTHTRLSDTLKKGEILMEIVVPCTDDAAISRYDKFRLRKSIDFAIVGLAYQYTLEDGVISRARLVLGAVAPVPLRRKKAEEYLIGRRLCRETAEKAAELALEGALPLADNAYKIDVAKAMVKRSIMGEE
ncbi:MAG: FAD-dependent oxidoreductase [Lachnospiraceae bacterium]|nr:FAD-dependent oxidoreductase [Lachnospiraceae bacterium]